MRRAAALALLALFVAGLLCPASALDEYGRIAREDPEAGQAQQGRADAEGDLASGAGAANATSEKPKETLAQILDEALHEEFKHEEEKKADVGKQFNETATSSEATQETVIIISKSKAAANRTAEAAAAANATAEAGHAATSGDASAAAKGGSNATETTSSHVDLDVAETDVDRIIDSKDNEYVLSKPNEESMGLNLDPAFVRDLTILVAFSALAGLVMEALGQPPINGYFVAGSLIGPGGLNLVKELVQVQSMAQLGVQLLLFALGLEFSLAKLRVVRSVALLGGLLQIALCAVVAGLGAKLIGTSAYQGVFVGAVLSMSSTSVVVKMLNDSRSQNTQQGQITIGTLILQDCMVGLLFAFMPVLSSASLEGSQFQLMQMVEVLWRVLLKLGILAAVAVLAARTVLPVLVRGLARVFSAEVFQLVMLAFCFLAALVTHKQGISAELGAFVAGVMLSATDQQEAVLHQLEPISRFFQALFISSTGLVLSPRFLMHHLPVLAAGVMLVVIAKTCLIAGVVSLFRYPADTALAVGINLAQIGEFAFVLLSIASQLQLVASNVYMLLMGVTALSLLATPLLVQLSARVLPRVRSSASLPSMDVELAGSGNVYPSGHGHGREDRSSDEQRMPMLMMDRLGSYSVVRVVQPPGHLHPLEHRKGAQALLSRHSSMDKQQGSASSLSSTPHG